MIMILAELFQRNLNCVVIKKTDSPRKDVLKTGKQIGYCLSGIYLSNKVIKNVVLLVKGLQKAQ